MSNEVKNILIYAFYYFYNFMTIAIFIRCILSWFPISGDNAIVRLLYRITEPIMGPIRNIVNKSPIGGFMIDFSPIIALILLQVIFRVIISIIASL